MKERLFVDTLSKLEVDSSVNGLSRYPNHDKAHPNTFWTAISKCHHNIEFSHRRSNTTNMFGGRKNFNTSRSIEIELGLNNL